MSKYLINDHTTHLFFIIKKVTHNYESEKSNPRETSIQRNFKSIIKSFKR